MTNSFSISILFRVFLSAYNPKDGGWLPDRWKRLTRYRSTCQADQMTVFINLCFLSIALLCLDPFINFILSPAIVYLSMSIHSQMRRVTQAYYALWRQYVDIRKRILTISMEHFILTMSNRLDRWSKKFNKECCLVVLLYLRLNQLIPMSMNWDKLFRLDYNV